MGTIEVLPPSAHTWVRTERQQAECEARRIKSPYELEAIIVQMKGDAERMAMSLGDAINKGLWKQIVQPELIEPETFGLIRVGLKTEDEKTAKALAIHLVRLTAFVRVDGDRNDERRMRRGVLEQREGLQKEFDRAWESKSAEAVGAHIADCIKKSRLQVSHQSASAGICNLRNALLQHNILNAPGTLHDHEIVELSLSEHYRRLGRSIVTYQFYIARALERGLPVPQETREEPGQGQHLRPDNIRVFPNGLRARLQAASRLGAALPN